MLLAQLDAQDILTLTECWYARHPYTYEVYAFGCLLVDGS
jgi:hypothetical protein